jgi:hypothetical protein
MTIEKIASTVIEDVHSAHLLGLAGSIVEQATSYPSVTDEFLRR